MTAHFLENLGPCAFLQGRPLDGLKFSAVRYILHMADMFAAWAISEEGQKVITGFKKNGEQLYTAAPANKTALF